MYSGIKRVRRNTFGGISSTVQRESSTCVLHAYLLIVITHSHRIDDFCIKNPNQIQNLKISLNTSHNQSNYFT